jgi:hypothetical protein
MLIFSLPQNDGCACDVWLVAAGLSCKVERTGKTNFWVTANKPIASPAAAAFVKVTGKVIDKIRKGRM